MLKVRAGAERRRIIFNAPLITLSQWQGFYHSCKVAGVEVGVDFGGGDVLVAEELLHLTNVGAPLQKVGGEAVAQGVGRDILGDACVGCRPLYEVENTHAAQPGPFVVEEEGVATLVGGKLRATLEVEAQLADGLGADGHKALLVALASHLHHPLLPEDVAEAQGCQLRHAQPTRVEHLDYRLVAMACGVGEVDGGEHGVNLLERECVGECATSFGGQDTIGGHGCKHPLFHEPARQIAQRTEGAGLGAKSRFAVVEHREVTLYVSAR